jgi:hypothetical protein
MQGLSDEMFDCDRDRFPLQLGANLLEPGVGLDIGRDADILKAIHEKRTWHEHDSSNQTRHAGGADGRKHRLPILKGT